MIYQSLTFTVVAGQEAAAMEWMKKMAQYQKEHLGVEIQVFEPLDGLSNRYVWIEKYESLASWEKQEKGFWTDAGAMAIIKDAQGLFNTPDSHFWRTVDLSA